MSAADPTLGNPEWPDNLTLGLAEATAAEVAGFEPPDEEFAP